jgi:hypothetical protein
MATQYFGNTPVYMESISAVTATPSVQVGSLRHVGDEQYIYVYNAGNSQINPAYAATVSAVSGYSVTVSSTTSVDIAVGVCKHVTLTTGTYGWLMTRGFCEIKMGADNSAAAGVPIGIGTDGTFAHVTQTTIAAGPILGKAMAAIASGASGTAFLRLY